MQASLSKALAVSKRLRFKINGAAIVALAGAALIAYGVALIFLPAGFVVGGFLLILAALDSRS